MLLRGSGLSEQTEFNLNGVTNPTIDSGVEGHEILNELTQAFMSKDWVKLAEIRTDATEVLGIQNVTDALTVATGFNGITRVANATGIPLDPTTAVASQKIRYDTGIDDYTEEVKSTKYS